MNPMGKDNLQENEDMYEASNWYREIESVNRQPESVVQTWTW